MSSYRLRMKAKMLQPSFTKDDTKKMMDNFYNNKQFATSVKNANRSKGDPILQKEDIFIPKEKKVQLCKINYHRLIRNKDQPKAVKYNLSCLKETINAKEPNRTSKKHFNKQQQSLPITIKTKRTYPDKYKMTVMEDIINRRHNHPYTPNKYQIRINKQYHEPSEQLQRMNNRGAILPYDQFDSKLNKSTIAQKYRYNIDLRRNTKDTVFPANSINDEISPKGRFVHKVELNNNY